MELSGVEYIGLLAIGGAFFWIIFQLDKLNIKEVNGELYSETFNENITTGIYTIVASSDDSIVGFFLKINNLDQNISNPEDSLKIQNKE